MDRNELSLDPCHLVVQLGVAKIISEPMVYSAQTEMRFHLTHVTHVYHWVRLKWFPSPGTFSANRAPILRRD
jgi:hypothetical protein